ncbi:intradiol ring-cleavage dioxygenase [Coleofasciculus sp. FACHB-64]|uniref:intradiol ring-cleavage dioxygenase n=1 Tax=Cyanophyceae TaxID=3028117 RepID=UPI0016850481|nr:MULTISPECIES: intradiol ring-cleavage dioxygenase [unclassified Coleofasciculus]MBD1836750.1 intradiol ring-cleavage dioxygenase [Coleofasciculus sp. FACHB-501]MBD2045995.1 intradiol ring-cleavage dioxygenase [Coleofasciculus sp. FACHB-64]
MKKDHLKRIPLISMMKRREVLGFLGGTAAVSLVGCWRGESISAKPISSSTQTPTPIAIAQTPTCVVKPQQTEGPYFVDEKLNRSDIRSDPSDGSVKPGVPLHLVFRVSGIDGRSCTPLRGATVDIWHCDALGVYSDVRDFNGDTQGQKFLRGNQVTDANGTVEFVTIYPGWYPGRTVHIHFKIRTDSASGRGSEFTSQLYFDDALTDRVHAQPPYAAKGQRTQRNDGDGIFQDGGDQLMLQLTQEAQGYVGTFDIGLQMT